MNKILKVATLAGQMILENGGETYRVEETIWRICKIYGAEEADSLLLQQELWLLFVMKEKSIL